MNKIRVLFICVHNSARSQMAEAFLNTFAGEKFEAESAGFEPGILNPIVVDALKEEDIDISGNKTKKVFDLYKEGRMYDYVITVCDESAAERCPIFPGRAERLSWSFEDPSKFEGSYDEKLNKVKVVRDKIKEKILEFLANYS